VEDAFDHVVANEDVNRAVHALLTTMERELAS
jgi:guanylate kinase